MDFLVKQITAGSGVYQVVAVVTVMPRGITVTAATPGYAHVGATAQAIPRPEEDRTATVSILAVPCHRDEIPAHDIAAALATRFRVPCAATVGLHVEHATKADVQKMLEVVEELIGRMEDYIDWAMGAFE